MVSYILGNFVLCKRYNLKGFNIVLKRKIIAGCILGFSMFCITACGNAEEPGKVVVNYSGPAPVQFSLSQQEDAIEEVEEIVEEPQEIEQADYSEYEGVYMVSGYGPMYGDAYFELQPGTSVINIYSEEDVWYYSLTVFPDLECEGIVSDEYIRFIFDEAPCDQIAVKITDENYMNAYTVERIDIDSPRDIIASLSEDTKIENNCSDYIISGDYVFYRSGKIMTCFDKSKGASLPLFEDYGQGPICYSEGYFYLNGIDEEGNEIFYRVNGYGKDKTVLGQGSICGFNSELDYYIVKKYTDTSNEMLEVWYGQSCYFTITAGIGESIEYLSSDSGFLYFAGYTYDNRGKCNSIRLYCYDIAGVGETTLLLLGEINPLAGEGVKLINPHSENGMFYVEEIVYDESKDVCKQGVYIEADTLMEDSVNVSSEDYEYIEDEASVFYAVTDYKYDPITDADIELITRYIYFNNTDEVVMSEYYDEYARIFYGYTRIWITEDGTGVILQPASEISADGKATLTTNAVYYDCPNINIYSEEEGELIPLAEYLNNNNAVVDLSKLSDANFPAYRVGWELKSKGEVYVSVTIDCYGNIIGVLQ